MSLLDAEQIILDTQHGMGDHLILSTLPERFTRLGKKVYLSRAFYRTRNDEQTDLLWNKNPFIEGWTDDPPNAGYARLGAYWEKVHWDVPDPIRHSEAAHDLPGPYNRLPRIYHAPTYLPEFANTVILDCSSRSVPFSDQAVKDYYNQHLRYPYREARFIQPRFKVGVTQHQPKISGIEDYEIPDIFTYCNMIYSCRAFAGIESGGHVLASAVKGYNVQPIVHCLMSTRGANSRMFTFPNVLYSYDQSSGFGHYQEPKPELDQYLNAHGRPRNMT
jgi:hypothetical protein